MDFGKSPPLEDNSEGLSPGEPDEQEEAKLIL